MKKVVLILDTLDKVYPENGKIRGGANKINMYLIEYFSNIDDIQLDIISSSTYITKIDKVNNIIILDINPFSQREEFSNKIQEIVKENAYDTVISNDLALPFGNLLIHSHSLIYRNKNCKNFLITLFQNFLRRTAIAKLKETFKNQDRKIFVVSKRQKEDYVTNLNFSEEKVICAYPGVDQQEERVYTPQNTFTFGIVTNNSANKGGFLFIFAMLLMKMSNQKCKANIILSKTRKFNMIEFLIKFLRLEKLITLIEEQSDMKEFYSKIDCLVVPSINETFGLVTLEAASYSRFSLLSNTAGSAEIIQDGINGVIFKRTSCTLKSLFNLYRKMTKILSLSEEQIINISKNAYNLSKEYTWENYINKISKELKLTM